MSCLKLVLCIITGILNFGNYQVVANIRGTPGVDYPTYSSIPRTSFKCSDRGHATGFYADLETRCQVFHYCYENRQETFLCPIGTTFNQGIKSCDYWYSSECESTEELLTPPEVPGTGYSDQPLIPVASPPYDVFEKIIELRDSSGNLYKQDEIPVQPGNSQESYLESNRKNDENGYYFNDLPTSLGNLDEIPQTGEQDLNFVPYDHDAVDTDDVEIVFSNDENTVPDFDAQEENFNGNEDSDSFRLHTDEILHRMYEGYSPEKQVNGAPNFGLSSDAMLHKRFSEVESKKRRIRRKPKYIVLQTNSVDHTESEESDPGLETAGSSKNTVMVTYAMHSNAIESNENADYAFQAENGKTERNIIPLSEDYSMNVEAPVSAIDEQHGYRENSENYQRRRKDAFEEIDATSDGMEQIPVSSIDDFNEFKSSNAKVGQENNEDHVEHLDSNNIFTLNEADFSVSGHSSLKESIEIEELNLETGLMSSDESNDENSYQFPETSSENYFIYTEESSDDGNHFSDFENGAKHIENFYSDELSDSYSSTGEMTGSETLNSFVPNTLVDELEDNQSDNYLGEELTSNDITYNQNEAYLESAISTGLNENQRFEDTHIEFERDGGTKSDVRINDKYLNFEENDLERSRLNENGEDYEEDRIYSTQGEETEAFENTHTKAEISVDSLEYFESEGQGYFVDEHGRIFISSGEESETLIYVGDFDPEEDSGADEKDVYLAQAKLPAVEDSYFPTESDGSVEVDFNSIDPMQNESGGEVAESQDIDDSTEDNLEAVFGEEVDQALVKNSIPQEKDSHFPHFPETETFVQANSTIGIPKVIETVPSNYLNMTNSTVDYSIGTGEQFLEGKHHLELEVVKNPQIEENDTNVSEQVKKDEVVQEHEKSKNTKFQFSIPLPANDYEKGLYKEQLKTALQDTSTVNSNIYSDTFYKELTALPVTNKKSKTVGRDSQTNELMNIKNRLFRNIKSDLNLGEVNNRASDVTFPSKIVDNIFTSFSRPIQPVQGNKPGHFPLHSPKYRNLPDITTRTGKTFKPSKIFQLIHLGKKLLKVKRAKLNNLKEYFIS